MYIGTKQVSSIVQIRTGYDFPVIYVARECFFHYDYPVVAAGAIRSTTRELDSVG